MTGQNAAQDPLPGEKRPSPNLKALGSKVFVVALLAGVGGVGYLFGVRMTAGQSSSGGMPAGMPPGGPGGAAQGQQASGGAAPAGGAKGQAPGSTAGGMPTQGQPTAGIQGTGGTSAATGSSAVSQTVQVTTAKTGALSSNRETAGTVVPQREANVSAETSGVVQTILAQTGASVQKGDTVVQLTNQDLQRDIRNAQLALQSARLNLIKEQNSINDNRSNLELSVASAQAAQQTKQQTLSAYENLYKIGGVSLAELTTARSDVASAKAAVSSAQASLSSNARARNETIATLQVSVEQSEGTLAEAEENAANAKVKAPFDGQIREITVNSGESVATGGKVFTLVTADRKVTFNVAPTEAASFKVGQLLSFKVGQHTYQVKVDHQPADPVNSVVSVDARILGQDQPEMGEVGTVLYTAKLASGITLPTTAVETDGSRSYVFVVKSDKARTQDVTTLGQSGNFTVVSGVNPGDQVITNPTPGLLDGAAVSVKNTVQSAAGGAP